MAKDLTLLLIIALPLIGFAINGLFGKKLPKIVVGGLATAVVFTAFLLATTLFSGLHGTQIDLDDPHHYGYRFTHPPLFNGVHEPR